jgi:hypothetical protein
MKIETIEEYLKRGGKIKKVPPPVSGDGHNFKTWETPKNKNRISRRMHTNKSNRSSRYGGKK